MFTGGCSPDVRGPETSTKVRIRDPLPYFLELSRFLFEAVALSPFPCTELQNVILASVLNFQLTDLIYPLKKHLANAWEQSFTTKIPQALDEFMRVTEECLRSFHSVVKTRLQQKSTFTGINVLQTQLTSRADGLTHMARAFNDNVTSLQREANRGFHPAIMDAMRRTYETCAGDSGKCLTEHVYTHR